MIWTKRLGTCVVAGLFFLGAARAARAETTELRIASFAASGSQGAAALQKTADELAAKTSGEVRLKYFAGASDERAAIRQLELGQLEGANVTSIGLAAIDQSIRVLELPLLFESTQELDYVADKLWPYFQRKFAHEGFQLGARGEVGFVYFLTKSELKTLADLQAQKLCLAADDPLIVAWFKKLGVNGVPLAPPEVSPALASGKLTGCYATPTVALAMQYSNVKFITSPPMSFGLGAIVLSLKAAKKLSARNAQIFESVTRTNQQTLRATLRKGNDDAKNALRGKGIVPSQMPAATATALTQQATELWSELTGKLYTKAELKMVLDARAEYRAKHKE